MVCSPRIVWSFAYNWFKGSVAAARELPGVCGEADVLNQERLLKYIPLSNPSEAAGPSPLIKVYRVVHESKVRNEP
jgi:hypothetical protein